MWDNIDMDRHFWGEFCLSGESLQGEIVYNKENGVILLMIRRKTHKSLGRSYGRIPLIIGKLHSGALVSLYHNHCIENDTQLFAYQDLVFQSTYMVWGPLKVCIINLFVRWKTVCTGVSSHKLIHQVFTILNVNHLRSHISLV